MSKPIMKFILTLIFLFFALQSAFGCSSPPKEYFYSPKDLIKNANGIFLAKAISSEDIENEYAKHLPPTFSSVNLEVLEVLKGLLSTKTIAMKGVNLYEEEVYDFGDHEQAEFWGSPMVGSGIAPGDCWAYGVYETGKVYLVFTGVGHIKAFEPIQNPPNDKWLTKIKELTNADH